jgi:tRNA(Ile2) C34 agmatinyltransferase TiaS
MLTGDPLITSPSRTSTTHLTALYMCRCLQPLRVVGCYPLKPTVPYSKRKAGVSFTVGPEKLSEGINFTPVY